jgi:GNAT superfamily N-acetyltransferase
MTQPGFRIATMSRSEVKFAIRLAEAEGWNPGLHDAATFHAADPDGFLVGLLDGVPIGCISAVRYPGSFGFIGLYIVVPAQRGKGFGLRLWNAAMTRLEGCNIGLDGVLAQQDNYRRSGFRLDYSNLRFEARAPRAVPPPARVVPLGEVPFAAVAAYDRSAFPAPREPFLRAWIDQRDSSGCAVLAGDRLAGYGVVRRALSGWKIGPLFADDGEVAERLFAALTSGVEGNDPVYLDVPELNPAALALAERHRMRQVFGTARMYTGSAPSIALERVFGVTTFELG